VVYEWHFGKPKTEVSLSKPGVTGQQAHCEQWALFYEVWACHPRSGAGSPENLKTVTSGSLANASCNLATDQGRAGNDSTSEMRIRFLGAL
jgi:hypothetical protein